MALVEWRGEEVPAKAAAPSEPTPPQPSPPLSEAPVLQGHSPRGAASPPSRREGRGRVRRAMDASDGPRAGLYDLDGPATTICRCEEVSLRELDEAYEEGAGSFNVLKGWTRVGMGSCQGRMCGPFVREWLRSEEHTSELQSQ